MKQLICIVESALSRAYLNVVSSSRLISWGIPISKSSMSQQMSVYQQLRFVSRFITVARFVLEMSCLFQKGRRWKARAKIQIFCLRRRKVCKASSSWEKLFGLSLHSGDCRIIKRWCWPGVSGAC
jgi:hypothetical protein